jgi:hypothetical protein
MKKIITSFIFILLAYGASAQSIAGDWYGTLNIQGASLHLVFHITKAAMLMLQLSTAPTSPWYRYFIAFNPADYLTKVKCPVLAIDGTLDMQVNSEANLAGIKASLEKGGNRNF